MSNWPGGDGRSREARKVDNRQNNGKKEEGVKEAVKQRSTASGDRMPGGWRELLDVGGPDGMESKPAAAGGEQERR